MILTFNSYQFSMEKGIDYPAVTTVFFCHDGEGHFVMQKRSKNCRDEQGRWEIGGGSLEFGLTLLDNLRKEVREELSVEPSDIEFLGYRDMFRKLEDGRKTHWVGLDFAMKVDRTKVKIGEPDSIDEIGWFTLENFPSPLHSQLNVLLSKYKDKFEEILKARK